MLAARRAWMAAVAAGAITTGRPLRAQTWPARPVRLVVTFPPGGSSDIVARLVAPGLSERLGQPVVVDNRPGAGSTIGAAEVARAAPDGYTLMLSNTAPISLSPFMLDRPPYDPVKSFTHIGYIGSVPNAVVVHPSVPARTMAEFITWARQQKDPINYGSGGVGSIGHILGQMLEAQAGLKLVHVGYKGSAPMHNDLVGGTILVAIDTLPQNLPFMRSGRLRLLAVTSPKRSPMAAELPTVIEAGLPRLEAENFFGLSGPAGLAAPVVATLHDHLAQVLKDPKVVRVLSEDSIAMRPMSVEEFQAFVSRQVTDWAPAVRASGARLG